SPPGNTNPSRPTNRSAPPCDRENAAPACAPNACRGTGRGRGSGWAWMHLQAVEFEYCMRRAAAAAVALSVFATRHLRAANHLLHLRRCMNRNQFDVGVRVGEHAKHFVREGLADAGDACEIEHDGPETLDPLHQALGLRTRRQVFVTHPGEP